MAAGDMGVVQATWKRESVCFMLLRQRGDVVSHPSLPGSLAQKGVASENVDLEIQRLQANDGPAAFCLRACSKQTAERPIRAQETGRPTGRALIYLSQRSDARNVRRVGSRLVSPTSWLLQPLVWAIRETIPFDPQGPTHFQRALYLHAVPYSQIVTPGCLVSAPLEPQSLSPCRELTGH
jgi:hypothetical protein